MITIILSLNIATFNLDKISLLLNKYDLCTNQLVSYKLYNWTNKLLSYSGEYWDIHDFMYFIFFINV